MKTANKQLNCPQCGNPTTRINQSGEAALCKKCLEFFLRMSGIEKVTHENQTVSVTANIPVTSTSVAKDPRCPYCGKPVIGCDFVDGSEGRYHKACTQPDYHYPSYIPTYPLNVPSYTPVYPKPIDVWCGTSIPCAQNGGAV